MWYQREHISNKIRRKRYKLAKDIGFNVQFASRIRDWTKRHFNNQIEMKKNESKKDIVYE